MSNGSEHDRNPAEGPHAEPFDTDANTVILTADRLGGFVVPNVLINHVTQTRIYGDGQVVFINPEVGFAEIDFSNWVGTVVSAKLPADIVGKINIATVKAAMSPKVRDRLIAAGFEPTVSDSPDKLAQMVKADYERNAQIVKAFNIQLNQ